MAARQKRSPRTRAQLQIWLTTVLREAMKVASRETGARRQNAVRWTRDATIVSITDADAKWDPEHKTQSVDCGQTIAADYGLRNTKRALSNPKMPSVCRVTGQPCQSRTRNTKNAALKPGMASGNASAPLPPGSFMTV